MQLLLSGFLFIGNFMIFMGPLVLMGISQIRGFEPGDAEWGVKLDDVRGQKEAKEEIRRIVSLWQSGEHFEAAGGKRERGVLFLGAPGTGKTMLAKAIATGFNSPFVTIPGSGFAQTFIGIDVIIVRFLARKAKKLAAKWGGQCIVFIDEIDAVGRRRAGLQPTPSPSLEDFLFFGPNGALNPTGDMILETRAWRERLFAQRAPEPQFAVSGLGEPRRLDREPGGPRRDVRRRGPAGAQPAADHHGRHRQPAVDKRVLTNKINQILDALVRRPAPDRGRGRCACRAPSRAATRSTSSARPTSRSTQLDPALTRPGRMGRHVWFRTPTKQDRLDIFDLYLAKVAHDPDLDRPERRDEIARITSGYSPAMIEQVCSLALTYAHHEGKVRSSGRTSSRGWSRSSREPRSASTTSPARRARSPIHEAGHAVAGHVYMKGRESARLDSDARQLARPPPGDREGGALQPLPQRGDRPDHLGPRRDGSRARLLRRELERRRRRPSTVTAAAAWMVGASGMGPERVELNGFATTASRAGAYRRSSSARRSCAASRRSASTS